MNPKISTIMSVCNEDTKQLEASIGSILHQTFQDFEYIIILDNPDNLEAKEYIKKLDDNRIIFVENEKNFGLPFSLNKGIFLSRGKYIARMDADDISHPERIEKQYHFLEQNPDTDLLFTGWQEIDEKGNILERIPQQEWFVNIKKYFFLKSMILHPTLMCKAEILKTHPYPLTDRPEDFILFLDLMQKNYNFRVLEENLFTYSIQNYNIELKFQKIRTFSQNFLPVLLKSTHFYFSPYFWYFVCRIFVEFLLSRNFFIFKIFYMQLFHFVKKFSL